MIDKRIGRSCLGLLLLLSVAAGAQTSHPSEARDGNFGAKLLVVDDVDAFWNVWERPQNPTIATTSKVTLSRPVYGMIVFHDCQAGADGNCKVSVRFEMTGPDGKPYDSPKGSAEAWTGPPAPDHNLQASLASIGFRLEPKDKLGRYEIKATLTDEVARRSVTLREYVTAEAEPTSDTSSVS